MSPEQEASERLREWASWGGSSEWLGFPSKSLLGRWIEQGDGAAQQGRSPVTCPEHIAAIDKIVTRLAPPLKVVCKAQYLERGDMRKKAKSLRISVNLYKERLYAAIHKVAEGLGIC